MNKGPVPQPLTKEFLLSNNVIFNAKTAEAARAIQLALFDAGFAWPGSKGRDMMDVAFLHDGFVSKGEHRKIYRGPSRKYPYYTATAADFPHLSGSEDILSADERLDRRFNALAARMEAVEQKLDRVLALLEPAETGKRGLKP